MEIFDPYPVETKWRDILPVTSPLNFLRYGLMSEFIQPLVQKYRLRDRTEKITKFIQGTTNDRLDDMVDWLKYIIPADKMPKLPQAFWSGSKGNKNRRIEWYIRCGISIQYLQLTYERFIKGPPQFSKGDRVTERYGGMIIGRIVLHSTKRWIMCYKCAYKYLPGDKSYIEWDKYWGHISVMNSHRPLNIDIIKVDPWKVKKVGVDTPEDEKKRNKFVEDYNIEYDKRMLFWNTHLEYQSVQICYRTWMWQKLDVWNLENIPKARHRLPQHKIIWDNAWNQIMGIIQSLK